MVRKKTDKERTLIINRIIELVKELGASPLMTSLRCSACTGPQRRNISS